MFKLQPYLQNLPKKFFAYCDRVSIHVKYFFIVYDSF
jgi:hypothetical protein